jgi:hypothetical protein
MKLLFRLTLLALAAIGATALYEWLRPRIGDAAETGNRIVGDTIRPALREATSSVKNASTHAAHQMADATLQAVEELHDSAGTASSGTARSMSSSAVDTATAAAADADFRGREPLSAMAAQDLGIGEGNQS